MFGEEYKLSFTLHSFSHSMEQGLLPETNSCSARQGTPSCIRNAKVLYRVNKSPP
jgi:hypothetical protein